MGKRRNRDRPRPLGRGCVTLRDGPVWFSLDPRTRRMWCGGTAEVPAADRDRLTVSVLALLAANGCCPADPLDIRDFLFGHIETGGAAEA